MSAFGRLAAHCLFFHLDADPKRERTAVDPDVCSLAPNSTGAAKHPSCRSTAWFELRCYCVAADVMVSRVRDIISQTGAPEGMSHSASISSGRS
jgi:hypothetical protein